MRQVGTGQAVQVLNLLLEYFGDRGERWTSHRYDDGVNPLRTRDFKR